MRLFAAIVVASLLFAGCRQTKQQSVLWYEPHIMNDDTDVAWFWEHTPTNQVANLTARQLQRQYESQTNYFCGTIVVHRYIAEEKEARSTICLAKSILCNAASNSFLIADGLAFTNAVSKSNFEDLAQDIVNELRKEVSNQASHAIGAAAPQHER